MMIIIILALNALSILLLLMAVSSLDGASKFQIPRFDETIENNRLEYKQNLNGDS